MKKILLSLVLLASTPYILSNNISNELPVLTKDDLFFLNSLYNVANSTPDFEKTAHINFDYYLDLLKKNTKIIQHKIDIKESKWSDRGLQGTIIISSLFTMGVGYIMYLIGHELWTGTFSGVSIPSQKLKELSSLKFTRAERKKLDRIEVKKITITYEKPQYSFVSIWEEQDMQRQLNNLSEADLKKLSYLARKQAIWNARMVLAIIGSCGLLEVGALLFQPLYEAIYYQEVLQQQLKDTKDLHSRLLREKMRRVHKIRNRQH